MAIQLSLSSGRLLRRGLDAQFTWCAGVGRLTAQYLRTMTTLARAPDAEAARDGDTAPPVPDAARPVAEPAPRASAAPPAEPAREPVPAPAIVLEGELGATAAGVFLVRNHLEQRISAPVVLTALTDGAGNAPELRLRFDPEMVTLEPHEQLLVRVAARIDDTMIDGSSYRGAVSVPGLPGTELPIVVRRGCHRQPALEQAPSTPVTRRASTS